MHATMQRRGEPGWSAAPAFRAGIPCTPIELNCDWHDNAGSGSGVPGYYVDTSPAGPAVVYFRGAVRQGPRRGPNPMLIGILPPDARPDRSVYELVHNFEDERRGAGEQRGLVGQEPIGGGRAQRVAGRVGHGPGVLRPSRNVFTIAHSYAGTYTDVVISASTGQIILIGARGPAAADGRLVSLEGITFTDNAGFPIAVNTADYSTSTVFNTFAPSAHVQP